MRNTDAPRIGFSSSSARETPRIISIEIVQKPNLNVTQTDSRTAGSVSRRWKWRSPT